MLNETNIKFWGDVKYYVNKKIIMTLLTFGIYFLFWMVKLSNDFARENKKKKKGLTYLFFSIITFGLFYFVWSYKMGIEIEKAGGKNEGVLYLILSVFGLGIISMALMQLQKNELYDRQNIIENY